MLHIKNINFNHRLGVLMLLGPLASVGVGIAKPALTHAVSCTDGSTSCIAVQFGQPVGERTVNPSSNAYSATQFYLPVSINIGHTTGYSIDYSVKVYGSGSSLTDVSNTSNTIPSVLQNTSYNDLGKDGSQWGIRWNFGDKIEDSYSDYRPVPSSINDPSAIVVADGKMDKDTSDLAKQLTLGFAVAVDGSQASGSYANTITVAVVASPKDARTLFDISTMQEMDSGVCERTTTPTTKTIPTSADINATPSGASYTTAIDTDGAHQGDGAYVPQRELTDTRDGKKYIVRKLADGNCWMVSNLEFDFVTVAGDYSTNGTNTLTGSELILTNRDTDLNSMREWTPAISATEYGKAGTVFMTQQNVGKGTNTNDTAVATTKTRWAQDGSDGLHSFSSAAAYPNAIYSTKATDAPSFGTAATDGEPWQRFGNLYNWTAATLGSSTKATNDGENAEDSICPRGWKLPSNTGADSFSNLFDAYGLPAINTSSVADRANQLANFPLNFLRTGNYGYSDGLLYGRTAAGYWWSATRSSETNANRLNTNTSRISPQDSNYRGYGIAVRCVARQD